MQNPLNYPAPPLRSCRSLLPAGVLILAALLLAACSAPEIPGLYRIDIQQGNVVTQDMLAQLEPGMDKRRVRFVLGTPLVADTFNDDRWDYIYTYKTGTDQRRQRNITVFFESGRLVRLEGDVERAVLRPKRTPERRDKVVKVKGPREERGILASLNPFSRAPERGEDVEAASESATEGAEQAQQRAVEADAARDTELAREKPDTVVTPIGAAGQREPEPLAPARAVDPQDEDSATTRAALAPAQDDASSAPDAAPDAAASSADEADDGPSWWERVKQRVSGSDEPAPAADTTGDVASVRDANADPSASESAPDEAAQSGSAQSESSQAESEPSRSGAAAANASSTAPAQGADAQPAAQVESSEGEDGDGGFFARIRDRFKIPKLPPLPEMPPVEAPEDFDPDASGP